MSNDVSLMTSLDRIKVYRRKFLSKFYCTRIKSQKVGQSIVLGVNLLSSPEDAGSRNSLFLMFSK